MNFLKYIELSAENLQFYLWFRDYTKRFEALPASERVLSPEWTGESTANGDTKNAPQAINPEAAAILKGTDFSSEAKINESEKTGSNPFFTPPRTPTSAERREGGESIDSYDDSLAAGRLDHSKRADGAFEGAGLKWKPCKFCCSVLSVLPRCHILIANSDCPALPRGNQSHHFHLHRRWRLPSAQPVIQGAHCLAPCSTEHYPSFGL